MTMDIGQAMVRSAEILAGAYTAAAATERTHTIVGMALMFIVGMYAVYANSKMED